MKYIAYCRKSSEEETKQIQSLETQERELLEYAKENNLEIVKILKESKSAKTDGNRPLFSLMLNDIRSGVTNALLVLHTDRLSRNGIESGQIVKLFEEGYLKEIRTPTRIYNSVQDMLYMDFDFVFASHYSRNLSQRVKEGVKTKLLKGEYPSYAPIGYVNKETKIYPDPLRAKYIKTAYELYSTGEYSLKQLTSVLYEQGFRTRIKINKVAKPTIYRILTDPVYYGAIRRKGTIYKGIHEPIVNKSTFDLVQDVFAGRNRSRKQKHEFTYRDFLSCAVCGCKLTATIKKERHNYYYCTNGKGVCEEHRKYLKQSDVYDLLYDLTKDFNLKEPLASLSLEMYVDGLKKQTGDTWNSSVIMSKQIEEAKRKLDRLLDMKLSERVSEDTYDRKRKEIENQIANLEVQFKNLKPQNIDFTLERVEEVKNKACSLAFMFKEGDDTVRRDLLNSLLWNASIKNGEIASVQYKLPYLYLKDLNKTDDLETWRWLVDYVGTYYKYI
ncbi:recombinase family protein [Candidatus Gottesmanbacteria bacterium]|nr:recombinase family protein [Candidatus Gottesmanbacteria bacterium]